jgi:hypothetical protein
MNSHQEKRRAPRIQPFVVPCRYIQGDRRWSGFFVTFSVAGGCIHTEEEPPSEGAALTIEVRLGRRATRLRFPAEVRWTRKAARGGFLFGMSFEGLDSSTQRVLDEVVEEFRRRAASIE